MKDGHYIIAEPQIQHQDLEKILDKRMPILYKEGHTEMFVELSKASCKAINAKMLEEWLEIQEQKIPDSKRVKYGEYAWKAWEAAEKADADMKRKKTLAKKSQRRVSGRVTKRI